MARVKRGTTSNKRRRNVLKMVKGYRFGRSTKERQAKEAIRHAGTNSYRDRRLKKRSFRQLWTIKINAATRKSGLSYSQFISKLKGKKIEMDRKVLAEIAEKHPETFDKIVSEVK